jgi:hypothetical protein
VALLVRVGLDSSAAGDAVGTFLLDSHAGKFVLHASHCRQGTAVPGVGLYDADAPALALGYFHEADGGEWLEARGPGVNGATRFDHEDCKRFEVSLVSDAGAISGSVSAVCDAESPGVIHIEGEATFSGCL